MLSHEAEQGLSKNKIILQEKQENIFIEFLRYLQLGSIPSRKIFIPAIGKNGVVGTILYTQVLHI